MITRERVYGRAPFHIIGIAKHNFIAQMLEMALTLKIIDGFRKTKERNLNERPLYFLVSSNLSFSLLFVCRKMEGKKLIRMSHVFFGPSNLSFSLLHICMQEDGSRKNLNEWPL